MPLQDYAAPDAPNPPTEFNIILQGPPDIHMSALADTLRDVLLMLGAQVESDPDHGFSVAQAIRPRLEGTAIRIIEDIQGVQ